MRRPGGPWSTQGPANIHLQEKHPLELHGSHLLTWPAVLVSVETLAHTACAYVGHDILV